MYRERQRKVHNVLILQCKRGSNTLVTRFEQIVPYEPTVCKGAVESSRSISGVYALIGSGSETWNMLPVVHS